MRLGRQGADGQAKPGADGLEAIVSGVEAYLSGADTAMIRKAYRFGEERHAGQVRANGEPYMVHPLGVARIVTQMRLDVPSVCAAFLHDCVEDTHTTVAEIEAGFGKDVAFLVDGVTKLARVEYRSQEARQAENFRKMLVHMARDLRVLLLKLADRVHNMRTLEHLAPDKRRRIARETIEIHAPLANRLGIDWMKGELEDLSFRHMHPEEWEDLSERLDRTRKKRDRFIEEMLVVLRGLLADNGLRAEAYGRVKRIYSIREKMRKQHIEFEQVYDLIAFRILVDSLTDCYAVLGVIHSKWTPVPGRFKDHIAIPKPNGYQSLHTTVFGPAAVRMEIQIRTHEMHRVAEDGVAAHWFYKEGGGLAPGGKDAGRFAWLRQMGELQQDVKDSTELLDAVKGDLFTDEVYVFTPKGEVKVFPAGATPVDFAYEIHTDVGHHCAGARVNGAIVPLRHRFRSGDTIEIMTNAQQRPSKDWLEFVVTSKAKAKIRSYVRTEQRRRSTEIGRDMLEKELRKAGISLAKAEKRGDLARAVEATRHGSVEELIVAIGYGKVEPRAVVQQILGAPESEPPPEIRESRLAQVMRRVTGADSRGIKVGSVDDMLVRYARCCSPVPGDEIVGFVTRGRGLAVHRRGCTRTLELDPERRVDVTWDVKTRMDRPVTLRVVTAHRPGILATLSRVFSDHGINITQVNARATSDDEATNIFTFNVGGVEQLNGVVRSIEQMDGVTSVTRL